jgi:purine nucleosidase
MAGCVSCFFTSKIQRNCLSIGRVKADRRTAAGGWKDKQMAGPPPPPPDARIPVWLDCDPGHDDALAIILAAYHPNSRLIVRLWGSGPLCSLFRMPRPLSSLPQPATGLGPHRPRPSLSLSLPPSLCRTPLNRLTNSKSKQNKKNLQQGVSTVASNHTLGRVTANAAAVLAAAGLSAVPLVRGAARPLFSPPLVCPAIHGASGLDLAPGTAFADVVAAKVSFPSPLPGPAPVAMAAAITAAHAELNAGRAPGTPPRRVGLVATGALTNVALLLWLFPQLSGLVSLSVMGGAEGPGNTHPCAEFNFAVDPHAGAAVFGAAGLEVVGDGGADGADGVQPHRAPTTTATTAATAPPPDDDDPPPLPVALCPLEVTHTALVTPTALAAMGLAESSDGGGERRGGDNRTLSPFRRAVRDVLLFFHASYASTFAGFATGPPLHDPCAVLLALEPEAFKIKPAVRIDVETASPLSAGQTVIDAGGLTRRPPNAALAVGVDCERLWAVLGAAIAAADAVSPLNR